MRVGVVGGGVIGLATAWQLKRMGADPFIVESRTVGSGCSWGNGGWVCPAISTPLPTPALTWGALLRTMRRDGPLYIKPSALPGLASWLVRFRARCAPAAYRRGLRALASLNAVTEERFGEIAADGVEFECARAGILFAFRDPAKAAAVRAEMADVAQAAAEVAGTPDWAGDADGTGVADGANGVAHRYRALDRAETYEQEPLLRPGFRCGILVESERHLRPESLTAGLARALRAAGADIHEGVSVTGFEGDDGTSVRTLATTAGPMDADAVVLAAGAETGLLAAKAGCAIPLTAGKGYSVTVDGPRHQLRQPLFLGDDKVGATPFDGALRFFGTMELSGINRRLDSRRVRAIRRAVVRGVKIPEAESGGREWVGMRPMVPDTLPVLGKLPSRNNVYVNTGHQMLGVTLSASTGWAMAQLVVEGGCELDLAPFAPGRFGPRRQLGLAADSADQGA